MIFHVNACVSQAAEVEFLDTFKEEVPDKLHLLRLRLLPLLAKLEALHLLAVLLICVACCLPDHCSCRLPKLVS